MFSQNFKKKYLLSIGQLYDIDFTSVFHKGQVQLSRYYINITGQRDPSTGLYYIDLSEPPHVDPPALHPFPCSTYEMKTKADLSQYLHRCAFSPVVHTCTKAIDAGYFSTWTGLTSDLAHKHLPKSLATAKKTPETRPSEHTLEQNFHRHSPPCTTKPACAPSPIPSTVC